ncbi:MAG: cytochrome P450 [Acidimicrobiia bacterium]|nr:cytochrome P450 [Acidimicrobiia bacterium]
MTVQAIDEAEDPFQAFNRAMGAGIVSDPYPQFKAQRDEGSVIKTDLGFGMPDVLTAASYEAVQAVLRDGQRFSSSGYAEVMGAVMGHTILEMDEPEHHSYRSLIQQAFTRRSMEVWERELVEPIVDELIDDILATGTGSAELVTALFFPFPVNVIAGLLGLPRADLPLFHRLTVELISVSIDMDLAARASARLAEYLTPFIHERRQEPGRDMISVLASAEHVDHDGTRHRLTDDEIISFCRLLLPAGAETTYRSSSNLFYGLLTNPEQLAEVRDDRSLLPQAIEEGLRWEAPLLTIFRTATVDTEVCGVAVAAGTPILINMGSANHDESRWPEPERFDIHRAMHAHISFASGPHMCLGLHLARMETKVVIERLLDRLPGVRLDDSAPAPYITGMTFRAPPRLDVVFDP